MVHHDVAWSAVTARSFCQQHHTEHRSLRSCVRANIKVSSTETGAIFGNLVYEATGYADRSVVVLNDIHIDIMDYISPAYCADVQFRAMWAEFEWENKVPRSSCMRCLHVRVRAYCWEMMRVES